MLDVIASLASIFGFGLQLKEIWTERYGNDAGQALSCLAAIAEYSKPWKSLHTKYHSLHRDINKIVETISSYNQGGWLPKDPSDIAPGELRKVFFEGNLNLAVEIFEHETNHDIKAIRDGLSMADKPEDVDVLRKMSADILRRLEEVNEIRDSVVLTHHDFIAFLRNIRKFMGDPKWSLEEVAYVVQQKQLLDVRYHAIILSTDRALMSFLDIYYYVINCLQRNGGVNSCEVGLHGEM